MFKKNKSRLTVREKAVLKLAAEGLTNGEIAEQLGITLQTTKNHMWAVMIRLKAKSRVQAVSIAEKRRLL
jgi:DNA-binding NarL/FixJ family response regulator